MRISDWSSDVCSSDLVSASALDARKIGYLLPSDTIVMNRHELLYVAVREAATLAESGWRAPLPALFPVAGCDAIATLKAQLLNMKVGGYISEDRKSTRLNFSH